MNKGILLVIVVFLLSACTNVNERKKKMNINGFAKKGFEEVQKEFENNFRFRKELGASVCVYYKGEKVVDLWGGYKDIKKKTLWEEDTLVLAFSSTKALSAITLAVAQSRGYFDYDDKITKYWPEFGINNKEDITIRQLLNFQSGLVLWDKSTKLNIDSILDQDLIKKELEKVKPIWKPGDYQGYSPDILAHFINQIFRLTDPKGRTIGKFFHDEIVTPLNIEFYIGLPDYIDDKRVAEIKLINPMMGLFNLNKVPKEMRKVLLNPNSLFIKSMSSGPKGYNPNSRISQKIEHPGGNGIGQARGAAKLMSILANGGKEIGINRETFEEIKNLSESPKNGTLDKILNINTLYNLGFMKPDPEFKFSSSSNGFGFVGASGSMFMSDPDKKIGYSYIPNKMDFYAQDPREASIREAIYNCIKRIESDQNE